MGTISLTLVDDDGTARGGLTGINWWVFNGTSPSSALTDSGTGATTDASGLLTLTTANSTADICFLLLSDSDGTIADCNSFAAPVTVTYSTTPDAFTFTDETGVEPGATTTSDPITVSGIDTAVAITVSGTGGEYNVNGGVFTSSEGTVVNGDEVRARHTSSSSYETDVDTVVTIGGVSDTFTSTTRAADYPTISSATLASDGETLTVVFNQTCSQGASYSDSHLNLDASSTGDNIGLTYVSGDGTTTWTFTAASTIESGETVNLDFDGTANSIEATDNGDDLQAVTDQAVTNDSTQLGGPTAAPTYHSTLTVHESTSGNSTMTQSVTVPSVTDGCLAVVIAHEDGINDNVAIDSVTFDSVNLTRAHRVPGSTHERADIWYLVNPTAKTADLVVTASGYVDSYVDFAIIPIVLSGVNQTDPTGNTGHNELSSTSHISCDVTISANSLILCGICSESGYDNPYTVDTGTVKIVDGDVEWDVAGLAYFAGYRAESIAGTYSVGATASGTADNAMAIVAVEFKGV